VSKHPRLDYLGLFSAYDFPRILVLNGVFYTLSGYVAIQQSLKKCCTWQKVTRGGVVSSA